MKKEFHAIIKINKMVIFYVSYYTLGSNQNPYFSTSAGKFIRSKRGWESCGQCQKRVLPKESEARKFFDNWDYAHLRDLTDEQYRLMRKDLDGLLKHYTSTIREYDGKADDRGFSFDYAVQLSKC